ncbi:hypothetical protein SAMN05443665_103857 [Actinomadura meyerae]|jgi:hypothetical protein|uniref:Antibiotic biosynthesis monooxygenase n=1 Tax=Actinomadura meyerae TaxID=240840 RepID=A0A239NAX7_9ACTN|nr:hypothetical protein [Actinomadura meyerae]SNT52045.1 hypothetical protein SAMN05443665_103857 [Actinomadura meyerae]
MTVTRFKGAADNADEIIAKHAALVSAIRAVVSGLDETWLGRTGEDAWISIWRWDSPERLREAQGLAQKLPETPEAFAVVSDVTGEEVELLDES